MGTSSSPSDPLSRILDSLDRVVIGYRQEKRIILASLLANGHVLLEGVPGIAKTTLVRALSKSLGLLNEQVTLNGVTYRGFSRIQFTPDLMPSDITGSLVFNPKTREFEPKLGPIFAYFVLADEINRATPRTQSALLEAMQERSVTIGNVTYLLERREAGKFFFVAATQNPVEQEGTYPLPEAQLDRFIARVIMGYPDSLEEEKRVLKLHDRLEEPLYDVEKVADPKDVIEAQNQVATVRVGEDILEYITLLTRLTRPEFLPQVGEYFELGVSPRGGIYLMKLSKAWAYLHGRMEVSKEDVEAMLFPAFNHRVIPKLERVVEYEEEVGRFSARYKVIMDGLMLVRKAVK